MNGKKGTIWRGLSIITILALLLGVLPMTPGALAAPGDSPPEAVQLWTTGQGAATLLGNVPGGGQLWYKVTFTDNTQQVGIALTTVGDPTFDYFLGDPPGSPIATNVKDFCIPSTSPVGVIQYIRVHSSAGSAFALNATPGTCPSPSPSPSPSPTPTAEPMLGNGGTDPASAAGVGPGQIRQGDLAAGFGTWFRFSFIGEPVRIALNAVSGGPDNLLVYYEASSVALSSQTGPEAT
ncbi:MAG: hypothetical protein Q8R28_00670, partial [Dehalococcoidia bacterium]|nr:hypothetical protein [Dehalococcoidia bacterium]